MFADPGVDLLELDTSQHSGREVDLADLVHDRPRARAVPGGRLRVPQPARQHDQTSGAHDRIGVRGLGDRRAPLERLYPLGTAAERDQSLAKLHEHEPHVGVLGPERGAQDGLRELELLDSLGEFVQLEFELPPELPLSSIELRAGERSLELELRTTLQVEHGLGPAQAERVPGIHPNLVQLRLSGDTAAALLNNALREDRIPKRWTLEGEPDPAGSLHVGVGWAEGRHDALELHLWQLEGDCAHVILRGEPHLEVHGQQLELGTEQAKVEGVVGSAKVRAGLFFSKTARRGVELIERTAAATEVELGTTKMEARVAAGVRAGDEIVLGLRLAPVASPARGRR